MKKSIQVLGLLALIFMVAPHAKAQTLHAEMFEEFGSLSDWMNVPSINKYIEETDELDEKFLGLLDEVDLSNYKIVPLGKVESGKIVHLLYIVAEYNNDGVLDFFNVNSATLNLKSGEKMTSEKYLLAGGTRGEMTYSGSYKLGDKSTIIFSQNEVNNDSGEETTVVKEYLFGKEVEFLRTMD